MLANPFPDAAIAPDDATLALALGATAPVWQAVQEYVLAQRPSIVPEWSYPGKKYGWSLRLKDKKRVVVYLLPQPSSFQLSIVYGAKATDAALESSDIPQEIKQLITDAPVYAEGRGIRIQVTDAQWLPALQALVRIKLTH